MMHNPIADVMTVLRNAESVGKKECILDYTSNLIISILDIFKENGYIASYKVVDNNTGGKIKVELIGMINDCKPIVPRHSVKKEDYLKFEKRYLPASNVGVMVVSTSKGIKSHNEVKGKVGGSLIAYVY
ncbi:MAG: 30S ribosomal protein S8 [Nanohaloarchaea archaeon]|nr:30S ribosomal protein S8 [Candidatus Nanohaloarchaea archaeon]